MGDEEGGGGDEEVIGSVELLSHRLGVDGVVWRVPAGQGYHLNTAPRLDLGHAGP